MSANSRQFARESDLSSAARISEPSPRRGSWLRPQFSLGTLFWLMLVAGMAAVWWRDRTSLDQRLQKLEQMYAPSKPHVLWTAADILGAPDDPTGSAGKSWCPLKSQGADWVEVAFDRAVPAATIDLYETYSLGCVTEVVVTDASGDQTTIWKGTDPTAAATTMNQAALFKVPVPKSIKSVQQVKIHIDSTGKGSWACIDAVGLTTARGRTSWATSSACSSVYAGEPTAAIERAPWYKLW
jgi:hypothetical protein